MSKEIAKAWTFKSSSGKGTYQTLQYQDGTTSCDCRGWTMHAQRICKHTRMVDMNMADAECVASHVYGEVAGSISTSLPTTKVKSTAAKVQTKRKIEW
jgi:hypothetical protein